MGIYSNGAIFGIKIYNVVDLENELINVLFKEIYDDVMSNDQMKNAYLFYKEKVNDTTNIHFKIYTECTSTLDSNQHYSCMTWYPISLRMFLEKFGK